MGSPDLRAGPALVLRSTFAELNRHRETRPLYLSPRFVKVEICRDTGGLAHNDCPSRTEWFLPGTEPRPTDQRPAEAKSIRLHRPTNGLQLAMDPRIPDDQEAISLGLTEVPQGATVDWFVDGLRVGTTDRGEFLWQLKRGAHVIRATVWPDNSKEPIETREVRFVVK